MQSMKLINLSSSSESDDSPPAIPKFNPGPKSNASGPKSLAMASMMQTMMDSSSDSDSESEMRPGPNASKLQMNETVSPVKTTDGPSATKPSYTGPMSMSSKLNTMMDSSSDSDSGDEIAVVTSSTAPTTVESTIPTKTQDAPAGVISGPASLASRLNDISDSDSDSSSEEEIVQAKPSIERSIPTKTSDAPQSGVMTGPASLASRLNDISSSSSEEDEGQEVRTTSLQPPSAQISMPSDVKQFSSSSSEDEEEQVAVPLQGNSAPSMDFEELPSAGSFGDDLATAPSLPLSQMDSMPKSQFSANNEDSSSSDEELPKQQSLIESLPPADYQSNSEAPAITNRSAPSFYDNVRPVVVAKQADIGSDDELSGSNWSDDQSSQGSFVQAKGDAPKIEPEIGVTVNGELGLGNELVSATPAKKFLEKIKSVAVGESFSWGEESYKKLFEPIWV